ncbi:hypothetical protein Kpol_1036p22 [Vanderwaltozyma polyspora DSM 70294]|uniref:Uncharacterized protein n=1 Tax=Vanderwaltozyma polyspora (strain ATCC 22028 / DSM 70294 / BCRC 21397 / CBS 2163 / NBRC 10782 / NRRL Y-8283 / UCD 57-17) TaxID=436907 RepID=A7TEH3_VANPO|nr:uncharacterized protein Kpol_1036p22 [Vanderwaltozyma polyspora DSM 70294]EDO19280.1 hypothetical protein Kpol_1036p22 [Vanderwaltozyma polyspora DSM 70294]
MADKLTVSYGLLLPHSKSVQDTHILPIAKILDGDGENGKFLLTCGRDGSVIRHEYDLNGDLINCKKLQAHSDWVTDVIEVNSNQFITVSHDFSIVLHTLNLNLDIWETKIIGDHDDYIKCIVRINDFSSDSFIFATAGLDRKVKIWSLNDSESKLLHTFTNEQKNETGSIYTLTSLNDPLMPFDLVAGDNNGDLILYSCRNFIETGRIKRAHKTNIKCIKAIDNSTKLFSTSSDGVIRIWSILSEDEYIPKKLTTWDWGCPIWCIHYQSLSELFIGDSEGKISKVDLTIVQNATTVTVFDGAKYLTNSYGLQKTEEQDDKKSTKKFHNGILSLCFLPTSKSLFFSFPSNSNLNKLDLTTNGLSIIEGGFALTRSSLLTNRRHVITENTRGEIQRWDIISCKLLNTLDSSEGTFDEVVVKYTSKEILSHWCSVSIKVGLLFVKLNTKFMDTEVYGSALEKYDIINGVGLNTDERYNLGKIMVNSLFNEFMKFEVQKDKLLREHIVAKKKESLFSLQKDNEGISTSSLEIDTTPEKKSKDKKRLSHFMKFGLGSPTSSSPNSSNVLENYNLSSSQMLSEDSENIVLEEQKSNIPSTMTSAMASTDKLNEDSNLSKGAENRPASSGSILNRKLKIFGSASKIPMMAQLPSTQALPEGYRTPEASFNDSYAENDESSKVPNSANSSMLLGTQSPFQQPLGANRPKVYETNNDSKIGGISVTTKEVTSKEEYMVDLLGEIEEKYKNQYNSNSSSLKLLTRKLPESKIIRDMDSPILKIKHGALLVVHSWGENACGGRVLFSTFLPTSGNGEEVEDKEGQFDEDELTRQEAGSDEFSEFDYVDYDYGSGMSRRQIFEQLENNLPYWFARALMQDTKNASEQTKLSFSISVWQAQDDIHEDKSKTQSNEENLNAPAKSSSYHLLKFGRSKQTEQVLGASDLPKVPDYNTKLVAPNMIKVKKIKAFIVERFESKTPEMKSKIDAKDWLELLCKGQVLDDDMTLNTVRTLYWKSQGEIALKYRRKTTSIGSPLTASLTPEES